MEASKENEQKRPQLTEFVAPSGFKMLVPDFPAWVPLDAVSIFDARPDDILIATYPKAGTTWTQEIAWLICNNVDIDEAKKSPIFFRSPFLEVFDFENVVKGMQTLDKWPLDKQRVMKTHLPYQALPKKFVGEKAVGKIIIVARNAKDVCVSFYFYHLMNLGLPEAGTWSEFLSKFSSGEVYPGSWFEHTLKYWEEYQKDVSGRIYFVTYEALKKDLRSEVASLAKFLGKELTGEQIAKIAEHCSFESMSKNKQTNVTHAPEFLQVNVSKFMRKGQVGDWKNHFTEKQREDFDKMYAEKMKDTKLTIPFEI